MNIFSARERGATAAVGSARSEDFPVISDLTQDLATPEMLDLLDTVAPGEFVLDRHFIPGISSLLVGAELVAVTDHGRTRDDSRHEIKFGQLLLDAKDEGEHSLFVAVKPLDTEEEAAHEYLATSYVADGNLERCVTFTPLGVSRFDNGEPAVITHYRHAVRSMDGIFWNPNLVTEQDIVNKALGRAATSLALFHQNNWVHGDAQAKNMAWDVQRPFENAFVIDLESAQPVGHLPIKEQHALKLRDVDAFVDSLYRLRDDEDNYVELTPEYTEQIKLNYGLAYTGTSLGNGANLSTPTITEVTHKINRARR